MNGHYLQYSTIVRGIALRIDIGLFFGFERRYWVNVSEFFNKIGKSLISFSSYILYVKVLMRHNFD